MYFTDLERCALLANQITKPKKKAGYFFKDGVAKREKSLKTVSCAVYLYGRFVIIYVHVGHFDEVAMFVYCQFDVLFL